MKVLVVGSEGFIGSNLVNSFKKNGDEVLGITSKKRDDNLIGGTYSSDLNVELLTVILNHSKPDICINASGAGTVSQSFENPTKDFQVNVVNVYTMLEAIRLSKPDCKFINLSSASVYGNSKQALCAEVDPVSPQSPYAFHKYLGERISAMFYETYNLATTSLRIFSAYGPGLKRQLFWDIFNKTNSDLTLDLLGSGSEIRDFIYIDDIADAIQLIIRASHFNGNVINLGSGTPHTIKNASEIFCSIINPEIKINFTQVNREGDPSSMQGDFTSLARLGFTPRYSLEEGLKKYLEWLYSQK